MSMSVAWILRRRGSRRCSNPCALARRLVVLALVLAACRSEVGTERPTAKGPSTRPSLEPEAPPSATPSAAIDKGLIRTVVRSHVREIRGCYEQGLATDPKLAGRVVVRFTIDPRGMVVEAAVASSDLPPQAQLVQACIVAAVKGWRFPVPPQSTKAEVLYPFVLAPGRTVTSLSGLIEGEQVDGRWFPVEGQPADTAIVEVLDSQHRPVPSVKVILAIAIGAASEEREAITDAAGLATFERLPSAATAIAMVEPAVRTESTVVGSGAVGVIMLVEVAVPSSDG
jgi:hypothetical protein